MEIDMNRYVKKSLHQALGECAPDVSSVAELAKESVKPKNIAEMAKKLRERTCYLVDDVNNGVPKLYTLQDLGKKYAIFRLKSLKKIFVYVERIEN